MSTDGSGGSSGPSKGPFHRLTGRPFSYVFSPGAYEDKKRDADNRLERIKDTRNQQVKLVENLEQKLEQTRAEVQTLNHKVNANNRELAQNIDRQQELARDMERQRKYWVTADPANIPDVIIGKIPYFGRLYTAFDLWSRGKRYFEDRAELKEKTQTIKKGFQTDEHLTSAAKLKSDELKNLMTQKQSEVVVLQNLDNSVKQAMKEKDAL